MSLLVGRNCFNMEPLNNQLCKLHDGFRERFTAIEARVTKTEKNVKDLWKRLDKIMLVGLLILGSVIANLVVILWK